MERREKVVTDIDISLPSWSEQGAGLRDSGSAVAEIGDAAMNTMRLIHSLPQVRPD